MRYRLYHDDSGLIFINGIKMLSWGSNSDKVKYLDNEEGIIELLSDILETSKKYIRLEKEKENYYIVRLYFRLGDPEYFIEKNYTKLCIRFRNMFYNPNYKEHYYAIFDVFGHEYKGKYFLEYQETELFDDDHKKFFTLSTRDKSTETLESLQSTGINVVPLLYGNERKMLTKLETIFYILHMVCRLIGIDHLIISDDASVRCGDGTKYKLFWYRMFGKNRNIDELSLYTRFFQRKFRLFDNEMLESDIESLKQIRTYKIRDIVKISEKCKRQGASFEEIEKYPEDTVLSDIFSKNESEFPNHPECSSDILLLDFVQDVYNCRVGPSFVRNIDNVLKYKNIIVDTKDFDPIFR